MQVIRIYKMQCFRAEIFSVLTACMAHPIQPDIKRRYQMKRLPKMLCALILCALMVTAAVSCGQKPAQQLQDPPQQEDPQPAPELKIAVDSRSGPFLPSSTGFIRRRGRPCSGTKI